MTGGLLQLATVGKEDSILYDKPQLFHFEKNYKKHSNFSIDQSRKFLGSKKFDSNFEIKVDKNSDLLKNFYFKLEIPYFDIIRTNRKTIQNFNRTESDKVYFELFNSKCYVFNVNLISGQSTIKQYYIYPELLLDRMIDGVEIDISEEIGEFLINISSEDYAKFYNIHQMY